MSLKDILIQTHRTFPRHTQRMIRWPGFDCQTETRWKLKSIILVYWLDSNFIPMDSKKFGDFIYVFKAGLWDVHTRKISGHQFGSRTSACSCPEPLRSKIDNVWSKKSVTVNLKKAIRKWRASIICFIVALELSMIFKQQAVDSYAVPAGQDKNFPFILVFSFSNYS